LFALFWQTAWSVAYIWSTSDLFGHGFLILPIVAWLIWRRTPRLLSASPRATTWGVAAMAGISVVWLLGDVAGVNLVRQAAFVGMIQAFVLAVFGWRMTMVLAFPLFYLYFAVPFGDFLVPPLQQITADFVVKVLRITGIPVYVDGLYLQTPTGRFLVAEACSGARFLISTVALGALGANIFFRSWFRRAAFMVLAVVVPVVANGFRAYAIVLIAHHVDTEFAASADHITFGLIFMSFVTLVLLLIGMTFRQRTIYEYADDVGMRLPAAAGAAAPSRPGWHRRILVIVAIAVLAGSWAPAYSTYLQLPPDGTMRANLQVPRAIAPWRPAQGDVAGWTPVFLGVDAEAMQAFDAGRAEAILYIGYYLSQRPDAELINIENRIEGAAWGRAGGGQVTIRLAGGSMRVNYIRMLPERHKGNDAAVAADYREKPSEVVPVLQDFLDHLTPLEPVFEGALDTTGSDARSSAAKRQGRRPGPDFVDQQAG
jgi:exosortase A